MNLNKPTKFMICALLLTIVFSSMSYASLTNSNNFENTLGNIAYDDLQVDLESIEEMFNYDSRENIEESDILNPFAQPNENLANSYGSGDANEDGFVNHEDYREMIISAPQNDFSDINGDTSRSSIEDINLLRAFLNPLTRSHRNLNLIRKPIINRLKRVSHQPIDSFNPSHQPSSIPYLPGHWNSLETAEERMGWMENMLAIDLTDEIPYENGGVEERWISGNYATQTHLNFWGYDGEDIHSKYSQEYLGRFNLPVYKFSYYDPYTGMGHGMNAILVGDDPLNIYDWALIEPQDDGFGRIEDYILNNLAGNDFFIAGAEEFDSPSSPDLPNVIAILGGSIDENGIYTQIYLNQDLIIIRPSELETL
jgi:hypothetical protein